METNRYSNPVSLICFACQKTALAALIVFLLTLPATAAQPATQPATLPAEMLTPEKSAEESRRDKLHTAGAREADGGLTPKTAAQPATRPATVASVADAPAEGDITISGETTYITAPVNPDGTINYVEYLNRKYSKGVTKKNNAFVALLEAIGPELVDKSVLQETCRRLNVKPPEDDGEYYIPLDGQYIQNKNADSEEAQLQFESAQAAPWRPDDNPVIAAWLKANEEPLAKVAKAVRNERYYRPFISHQDPPQLIDVPGPGIGTLRHVARALIARAMMHAGEGKFPNARRDLITVHCLARCIGREPFLASKMVSLSIDDNATEAETKLLQKRILAPGQCGALLVELHGLPKFPDIGQTYRTKRLLGLDYVMILTRSNGIKGVNWNGVLRTVNHWYDRWIASAGAETHAGCSELAGKLREDLAAIKKKYNLHESPVITAWESIKANTSSSADGKTDASEILADILAAKLIPNLEDTTTYWFEHQVKHELARAALALEAYRGRHMKYPVQLGHLKGAYFTQTPRDLFTDMPLQYRRTNGGYVLYSVGPNMKDDGGSDDEEKGHDDIVIRIE